MSIYTNIKFQLQFRHALCQECTDDIALSYISYSKQFAWFDKKQITTKSRMWRQLAVLGYFKISKYNNKEQTKYGRTWYFLVGQPCDINHKIKNCNIDPFGLYILGESVSGYIYAFNTEKNRDAIYEYVMKYIDEPEDECDDDESISDTASMTDDDTADTTKMNDDKNIGDTDITLDKQKVVTNLFYEN